MFNIEKFGRNLGFGIKPWVQKFGVAWQFHLAKAIINPERREYRGFNIPISHEMRREAEAFLAHNAALSEGHRSIWHKVASNQTREQLEHGYHHTLINKAFDDPLRYKAIYGTQKYISPSAQQTILDFKDAIKFATSRNEKRALKEKLREFQKANTRYRWEVEAEKYNVIPRTQTTIANDFGNQYLRNYNIEKLKMERAKLEATKEAFWEKQGDGMDMGEYIGSGADRSEEESDREDWVRLVNYLKKARWIKLSVWKSIMDPKNTHLRAYVRKHIGDRKFDEFFLSYNAQNKYATNAYFRPGSEYGTMKTTYENKDGELSPLQRRRSFTKGGKEKIKSG